MLTQICHITTRSVLTHSVFPGSPPSSVVNGFPEYISSPASLDHQRSPSSAYDSLWLTPGLDRTIKLS